MNLSVRHILHSQTDEVSGSPIPVTTRAEPSEKNRLRPIATTRTYAREQIRLIHGRVNALAWISVLSDSYRQPPSAKLFAAVGRISNGASGYASI